jgi:uncharacterized phage-associated protein
MNKIYDAVDIAKYILLIANENGDIVTNLKLQKLLYYAQAWYMVHHEGKKLFSNDIEAWKFGPVVKGVYDLYKKFSRNPIDEDVDEKNLSCLSPEDRKFMDEFLGEFMDHSALSLINMIHNELPWQEAFDEQDPYGLHIISTDSMYDYYSKLK